MLRGTDLPKKAAKGKSRMEEEQAARVVEVLKNIAPRHAEVVQILARLQLGQKQGKWVDYAVFLEQCKARYVVSKASQLQPYLMELKDHRLITSKTEEGTEYLCIPYNNEKLQEILAYQRGEGN